ncbi:DNA-binding GntR family transcriptional regulator [Humibacillus xanthopallidus]|uniref:DNA-binding GntR family transcriptional regulator n=1 Tax=Humibacillus xanthopallidus TaxID=412689 RepID=A0A543PSA9_9MICO|nr:GntR family transcriptional regulator [Humibacillus xanthopallidus]TQN46963.1 DNA-binding GntR family transcriptional regulator [Humibacillus xanthopallidus]
MDNDGSAIGMLRPQSLVELATDRLRSEILSGALVPGERLVEEQLTQRFQISRAPLREALRLLMEQGLVEHLPRRGARVQTYSDRDFDELFAVRNALERFALTQTGDQGLEGRDLSGVESALATLRDAAQRSDRLEASNAHRAFHLALVALAGNRQLLVSYEPIIVKLQLYMAANLRREADTSSPIEGVRRHERLLEALLSGDPVRIGDELDRHGARRYFH